MAGAEEALRKKQLLAEQQQQPVGGKVCIAPSCTKLGPSLWKSLTFSWQWIHFPKQNELKQNHFL